MNLLQAFRTNVGTIKSKLASVRGDIEQLRQRREQLRTMPLPIQDRVGLLAAELERRASAYGLRSLERLRSVLSDPFVQPDSVGIMQSMILFDRLGPQETEAMLAYLFPDQVKIALRRICELDPAKPGPSREERAAEMDRVDRDLVKLEAEERAILEQLEEMRRETSV